MTTERDEAGHPVEWKAKKIAITRLHLEEDAGKNVHEGLPDVDRYSYIDLNRAGTPLAEIVTEPDFRTSWEAYDYVNHVRRRCSGLVLPRPTWRREISVVKPTCQCGE